MTETQTAPEAPPEPIPHTVKEEARRPGSLLVLSIEVPGEVITQRLEAVLDDFKKEAVIPGFRRGKAPLDLVRRRLSKAARGEAVSRIVPALIEQIITERKIAAVADPKIENLKNEEGQPISFDLLLEVRPEIDLPDLTSLEVTVDQRPVTAEMVEHQLTHIQRANAVMTAKDGPAAEGDAVTVDVDVIDHEGNAVPRLEARGATVRTAEEGQILPAETIAAILGKRPGERVAVAVKQTVHRHDEQGGHHDDEVTWEWRVLVKEVKSVTLPDLDDEFAKDVGDFDSLDDLRAKVRADLEKSEQDRQRDAAVGGAIRQLLDRVSFDAPASLVAQQQYRTLARDHQYLQAMGMNFGDLAGEKEQYWESTLREAEQRVRAELLLAAIGDRAQIQVTGADVDAEIERIAAEAGRKPLAIRAQLEARKQIDALRDQVARRKIVDHLLAQVRVRHAAAGAPEPEPRQTSRRKKSE